MTRSDFIDEIFAFFRCKDEALRKAYDLAFTVNYQVDWQKLYTLVVNEAETRYLPAPKWFKAKFPLCKMHYNGSNPLDGTNLVIKFENGKTYPFVLWETREQTLAEVEINLKNMLRKKGKNVKEIKFLVEETA